MFCFLITEKLTIEFTNLSSPNYASKFHWFSQKELTEYSPSFFRICDRLGYFSFINPATLFYGSAGENRVPG
jgi:hypothetical protein